MSPTHELEHAHHHLSRFLDHVLGFIVAFSVIYIWSNFIAGDAQGHLDIAGPRQTRHTVARTHHIEEQVEHWNLVHTAIKRCLEWNSQNRTFELQALRMVRECQKSNNILRGALGDTIVFKASADIGSPPLSRRRSTMLNPHCGTLYSWICNINLSDMHHSDLYDAESGGILVSSLKGFESDSNQLSQKGF